MKFKILIMLIILCSACTNLVEENQPDPVTSIETESPALSSAELVFVNVPSDGNIPEFKITATEISNEQYTVFLNEAYRTGFVNYDPVTEKVYDQNGKQMIDLAGSRVVKDHNKDGVFDKLEMENPLNRCFIQFNEELDVFEIVDPVLVDWNQYFDPAIYPNVVDSIHDWYELSGNPDGFVGEGDLDGELPTIEEVKKWPVNFIKYYGAKAFAEFYGYDLPTLSQWKLAAKGGEDFLYSTSDGTIEEGIAWINMDGPGYPPHKGHVQPVDSKLPNPLGIYHMGGNVWEWIEDWYRGTEVFSHGKKESEYYIAEHPEDEAHLKGLFGGSFNYFPQTMSLDWNHAAKPLVGNDHFGFRVVKNDE